MQADFSRGNELVLNHSHIRFGKKRRRRKSGNRGNLPSFNGRSSKSPSKYIISPNSQINRLEVIICIFQMKTVGHRQEHKDLFVKPDMLLYVP